MTPDEVQPLDELYTEGIVTEDGDVIDMVNIEDDGT